MHFAIIDNITTLFQVIMNHLWFDMALKDAVQAPRVHSQLIPDKVFVETRFPNETVSILKMYKHKVCGVITSLLYYFITSFLHYFITSLLHYFIISLFHFHLEITALL